MKKLIFREKIFELGAKTSALIAILPSRQTSGVVVQLDGLVDRSRNLNLDLFVGLVGPQSLALDGHHLLLAVVVGGRRLSGRLRRLVAEDCDAGRCCADR